MTSFTLLTKQSFIIMLNFIHHNLEVLKNVLEDENCILIDWFLKNFMKANPTKFQSICIGKNAHDSITSFNIDSVEIKCEDNLLF